MECRHLRHDPFIFLLDPFIFLSRIGAPIDQPQIATAQLLLEKGRRINEISAKVEAIFEREFADINSFCADLARGKYAVC
jgi:S-adenosylmethionine synthetase